jgi:hypothetical protein
MIKTQDAVMSLRPGIEWSMSGEDVAGITWHTKGVEPLTQSEVDAEMVRLESAEATVEANRVATITAARDHAASLGFTDAMLAVMYPNLAP